MKKHIVCFGDSNTHGACADPRDSADGGTRFNEEERWTCLLQEHLGREYLVLEEGLGGRTTVFHDPVNEGMSGLDVIYPILKSHEPVDLLIIMLGTNDVKERYSANASLVALAMDRLLNKVKTVPCWGNHAPNVLVICPPHIPKGVETSHIAERMGKGCVEKSRELSSRLEPVVRAQGFAYLDAEGIGEFNQVDFLHLTRRGHSRLAQKLAEIVPTLI